MKLRVCRSGGFANIQLESVIDTSELAPQLAEKLKQLLQGKAVQPSSGSSVADAYQYELTCLDDQEQGSRTVGEMDLDPDLVQLLSDLVKP